MRTGELAKRAGVSVRTIENYLTHSILSTPEVTEQNTYREFTGDAVEIVKITSELTSFGFKLNEISPLLQKVPREEIDSRLAPLREFRKWVQTATTVSA